MNTPVIKNETFEERICKIRKAFAERFKQLRCEAGYTQSQLANLLHISRSTLCTWEHAKHIPDYQAISDICDLFDISCDYLLGVSSQRNFHQINPKDVIISNKAKFIDVSKLNDENLYLLVNYYISHLEIEIIPLSSHFSMHKTFLSPRNLI